MGFRRQAGFSFIELMVSAVIFSVVLGTSMLIYGKFQNSERVSRLQAEQHMAGEQLKKRIEMDVERAVMITGEESTEGELFEDRKVYGILRQPFEEPGSDESDGVELFVIDAEKSTQDTFTVLEVEDNSGDFQFEIGGDFQVIGDELEEDLFVVYLDSGTELFSVDGNISYDGQTSTFAVNESISASSDLYEDLVEMEDGQNPILARVSRSRYQIGQGDEDSGLHHLFRGEWKRLSREANSLRIFYELEASDDEQASDCEEKNFSRYFAHPTSSTECSWNEIVNLHMEIVLQSEEEVRGHQSVHPHTGVQDGRIRHLVRIAKAPGQYMAMTN